MNQKQQTNQRSTHAYVQAQEPVTALDDTRMPNQPVKIQQMKPKRSWTTAKSPMHQPLVPAIVFVVFFWVYRDQGSLKPYLGQQKKQKTIKGGATVCVQVIIRSNEPNQQTNQRSSHIYTQECQINLGPWPETSDSLCCCFFWGLQRSRLHQALSLSTRKKNLKTISGGGAERKDACVHWKWKAWRQPCLR